MSIRAIDIARRIQDGQTLAEAASALVPAVLNMMRIRGVSLESPEKGEKVITEFQTLWEATGRRLLDRGHAAGLLFLIEPTRTAVSVPRSGCCSSNSTSCWIFAASQTSGHDAVGQIVPDCSDWSRR